jgi:D-threo-aldose 1-dehydrogenase
VSGAHGTLFVPRAQTGALIAQATGLGVSVFDTAPAYGNGEAERRLGAALSQLDRDQMVISTKAGLFSFGLNGRRRDFSPDAIEASVRASLARLQVSGVDLLFLHGPDPAELTPALFARLEALRSAGAFAALGVAGRGAELDAALETGHFAAMMAPVHPFLEPPEEARLSRAAKAGVAVFAIETAGDLAAPPALPRSRADLYRLARSMRLGTRSGRGRVRPGDGLAQALARAEIVCALTTTTRIEHLIEAAGFCGTGGDATGPQKR